MFYPRSRLRKAAKEAGRSLKGVKLLLEVWMFARKVFSALTG